MTRNAIDFTSITLRWPSPAVRLFHDFRRVSTIAKCRRVAEECLFGENWGKLDVKTYARIKKVIWDQLLAIKAEIIQS